ncbi:MAG TPA: hypothetical protein VI341_02470 [Actinomycetota bacterium]
MLVLRSNQIVGRKNPAGFAGWAARTAGLVGPVRAYVISTRELRPNSRLLDMVSPL